MNILALNWNDLTNPYAGGAEVQLEELLRRLAKFGHSITLFCSGYDGCVPEETIEGLKIIRRGNRYNFNLVAPRHLRRMVRDGNYDLLIEDINKIPFYTPFYLPPMKRLLIIPHLFATTVFQEVNFLLASYVYLSEIPLFWIYRNCHFNVVSESTAEEMMRRGVPEKDISIIYNGVDRSTYFPDDAIPKCEQPTIMYLGRIKKYKSIQHLIRAFALVKERKFPDARLMIVGDGDYAPKLKALARSLNLVDSVEFTGFVPTADKVDRLRKAHVAVLPSVKEGWGLTNIEANAVGTAVIAADSPGLRDSVRHGVTGYLYEYGNIEQLTARLATVLGDEQQRLALQKGALEWANNFSWDESAKQLELLARDIVEERL
jgi:glycosyltransferase involved in cell wall biosynthesis